MAAGETMTLGELKQEIAYAEEEMGFTDSSIVYVYDRDGEDFFAVSDVVQDTALDVPALGIHVRLKEDDYQPEGV